jgi:hypothetical protein
MHEGEGWDGVRLYLRAAIPRASVLLFIYLISQLLPCNMGGLLLVWTNSTGYAPQARIHARGLVYFIITMFRNPSRMKCSQHVSIGTCRTYAMHTGDTTGSGLTALIFSLCFAES